MGLSYKEIKELTMEEEVFFIEAYTYFNEKRYGKSRDIRSLKSQVNKARGLDKQYKNEIEELRKERDKMNNK